jgi:hypothetical protein
VYFSLTSVPTEEDRPMNDAFAPDYLKFFGAPNPGHPSMPWMAWGLVNILSLATMYAVLWALPDMNANLELAIRGIFVFAPAIAAGFTDGRKRVVGVLTLSGWAFLLVYMVAFSFTEAWRRDCGLGTAFAIYFAMMGAAIYPLVMALVFTLGRLPARLLRL